MISQTTSSDLETPSGKDRGSENFPVGSRLIRPALRPHIHAFYRFARTGDDIADNPDLAADEKIARLSRLAEELTGAADGRSPAALAMRGSLEQTRLSPMHCLDLLTAFKRDAIKLRYRDWPDLYDYCRYSAMPVGRHVLDMHDEDRATWGPSDALCAALQVLNHVQDCVADHRTLDRVYLPLDDLHEAGGGLGDLAGAHASPALRRVFDDLLDETDALLATARDLPRLVADPRLRVETATIIGLAARLGRRLRRGDPVATRIKLRRRDFAFSLVGALPFLRRGAGRAPR